MNDSEDRSEQRDLELYWKARWPIVSEARAALWERRLDKARIVNDGSCFFTGSILLGESIEVLLMDQQDLGVRMLDCAEHYLAAAEATDDLSTYGRIGQAELGRAQRLKRLTLVRWLRGGALSVNDLRRAQTRKEGWLHQIFSSTDWRSGGFSLADWMLEYLVAEAPADALSIYGKYGLLTPAVLRMSNPDEETLSLVAECLLRSKPDHCLVAKERLETLYREMTAWGPHFDHTRALYEDRLLYALVRGKSFKGTQDPIALIKMMKLRQ